MATRRQFLESLPALAAIVGMPRETLDELLRAYEAYEPSQPQAVRVWLDDFEITGAVLACEISYSVESLDVTTFSDRVFVPMPGPPRKTTFSLRLAQETEAAFDAFLIERMQKRVNLRIEHRGAGAWMADVYLTRFDLRAQPGAIVERCKRCGSAMVPVGAQQKVSR